LVAVWLQLRLTRPVQLARRLIILWFVIFACFSSCAESQSEGQVGAGLTGITVAARLAENETTTVLLIEAGNDDRSDSRVYDLYSYGDAFGTVLDWAWSTDVGKTIRG